MAQDDSSNQTAEPTSGKEALVADEHQEFFAAPVAHEVDPELVNLSRPPRRRHPLISALVIVLSLYLMYFVRADLLYFFQPRTPQDLGEVSAALAAGKLVPNRYVTLRGAPDRKHAILLKRQLSGWDSFVRLLQTDNRVYVQRHRRQRSVDRQVVGFHSGRIVPLETLPYHESVSAYLAKTIHPEHEIAFDTLVTAKADKSQALRDKRGRTLTVDADSEFWINVSYPDEWVVQLARSVHPSAEDAQRQLAGVTLPYQLAADDSKMFWRFVVLARGEQLAQLLGSFSDPGRNAGVVRRQVSYTASWRQLRVEGDTLVIDAGPPDAQQPDLPGRYRLVPASGAEGEQLQLRHERPLRLPKQAVLHLSTTSRFEMPADALVLVAGDRPDDYWYYLLLYCVLGLFLLLNAWALMKWQKGRAAV